MAFLKTVLIILFVYYLLKILAKWFVPRLFSYAAKKTETHFKEKFGDFMDRNNVHEERVGEVIIDKKPNKNRKATQKVGEYIDFEELD